ncbi:hypothetical protein TNCV_1596501 [Trichonephila clavipes]|nr:hypothetical protein TNCV_1596501 [Trichonephila clavipes]
MVKEGSENETVTGSSFTNQELCSNARFHLNLIWRIPPKHRRFIVTSSRYFGENKCDRDSKTALTRLTSGHLKCIFLNSGRKIHPIVENVVIIQVHGIIIYVASDILRNLTSNPLLLFFGGQQQS